MPPLLSLTFHRQQFQQRRKLAVIGNDYVRAGPDQPFDDLLGQLRPVHDVRQRAVGAACELGVQSPGMLVTAKHLLDHTPQPTRQEIAHALSGNLCRCTGYQQIYEAVEAASVSAHRRTGEQP